MHKRRKKCKLDNCFHVHLDNDMEFNNHVHKWKNISVRKKVERNGVECYVHVCKHKLKDLEVNYAGLTKTIECKDGEEVYQAVRARSVLSKNKKEDIEVGRVIGKIKENKICEEYVLDSIINKVVPTQMVD